MTVAMYRELLARAEREAEDHFRFLENENQAWALALAGLNDLIDTMTWNERLDLRDALVAAGETRILQNLSYDYERQAWITRGAA